MTDCSKWLVVSDVDGTALEARLGTPRRNIEAARRFTAAGGRFTFASGRSLRMLRIAAEQFPVNAPLIALNGSVIVSPDGGRVLAAHPMAQGDRAMAGEVRDYFEGKAGVLAVGMETYYAVSRSAYSRGVCLGNALAAPAVCEVEGIPEPLYKVVVMTESAQGTLEARDWLRRRYAGQYDVVVSGGRLVEVMERGVSKGRALRELAGLLDVPMERVAAIGDNENDVEMLRAAGLSAAPGDAQPEAKAAAGRILCGCMEGAVGELLETLMTEQGER